MDNITWMLNSFQSNILESFEDEWVMDTLSLLVTLIIAIAAFFIIFNLIRRLLLKMAKTKKQISNVNLFLNIIKYIFGIFILFIVISSYFGTWIELGLTAGILTLAVGWALQKPLTGLAAWFVIALKRPFVLRDRVMIGDIKGDIADITLTHIYLAEIGGTIDGEEQSGRITMIPNSLFFENVITNYTQQHEYILDEVTTAITYESNLKKAENIMKLSVIKIMTPYHPKFPKKIPIDPHIRLKFQDSGINVTVRYHVLAKKRNSIATDIRREIYSLIKKAPDVQFAYPHAEVLLRKHDL